VPVVVVVVVIVAVVVVTVMVEELIAVRETPGIGKPVD
jgi:hypothetical protein